MRQVEPGSAMTRGATWAVVTPVFEDREAFARLCLDLARLDIEVRLEVIAVDDGSVEDPPALEAIANAGLAGRIIRLKRNVGHQMAISVGLGLAAAEPRYAGVVVMDCDGEDRPDHIQRLIAAGAGQGCDAAVAIRKRRTESVAFRVLYRAYRQFFRLLTGRMIRFGNFCALERPAALRLAAMQETRLHLAAALMKSRLRRAEVATDRGTRYAGRSRMSFYGLALHGVRAVAVFDDAVLTRMAVVCAGSAVTGAAVFAAAVLLKLIGQATPGWLTLVTGFLIMVFLQTGVLTLVTLIMNGLSFRSPAVIDQDATSLILDCESVDAHAAADAAQSTAADAARSDG